MLTSGQCVTAGYLYDGGDVACADCAEKNDPVLAVDTALDEWIDSLDEAPSWTEKRDKRLELQELASDFMEQESISELSQYDVDSDEVWSEEGLWCCDCGKEIVEPYPEIEYEEEGDGVEAAQENNGESDIDFLAGDTPKV